MALLKSKNYESITAGLNKMVNDLLTLADQNNIEAGKLHDEATRMKKEATTKNNDANRARNTASKIEALIS